MGLSGTEFMSARNPKTLVSVNGSNMENFANLLVVDSYPPLGLMPNDGVLHAHAVKNSLKALLDSMFEAQSVLQHRDALEVAVACVEGGMEWTGNCVRVMHLIESTALRDARNKHGAMRRLRFALQGGTSFRDSSDCQAYAKTLFAEVCSYAKGLAILKGTTGLRVTVVTSCSVAENLKQCANTSCACSDSSRGALKFRFFSLVSSKTNCSVDTNKEPSGVLHQVYEVENYTASISWALRSVLGDALESRGTLNICDGNGKQTFSTGLAVRPRLVCTLGTAPLYNSRVALPEYVTIEAMQRVCIESVGECLLHGVPHVLNALDDAGRVKLAKLIHGLQERKELLVVEVDAAGPFQKRFGVLLPSRATRRDVLLLRDLACAETIVPLGIWDGESMDGAGGLGGSEDADAAARQVVQAVFSPPVRRSST